MSEPSSARSRSTRSGRQAITAPEAKLNPTMGMVKPCQAGRPRREAPRRCTPPRRATPGGQASTVSAYASSVRSAAAGNRLEVVGVTTLEPRAAVWSRAYGAVDQTQSPRSTLLSCMPAAPLFSRGDLERSNGSGLTVLVDGHVDQIRRRDAAHLARLNVFGLNRDLGLDAGAACPGDLGVHDHQVANVDRLLERHRIHDHVDDLLARMSRGAHSAGGVGELHQRAAV